MARLTFSGRALVAGAVVLSLALPAIGAEAGARRSRYRLGPIRLWPDLTILGLVDSNPYGRGAVAGGDLLFVVSPGFEAEWRLGRRLRLSGEGNLDWNRYSTAADLSYTNLFGSGRAELDIGALTLFGEGSGSQYRQIYGIEFDQDTLQQEASFAGGARARIGHRLTVGATARASSYRYGSRDPASTISRDLDRDAKAVAGAVSWDLTRRTALFGTLDLVEERFLYGPPGDDPGVRSLRARAGFSFGRRAAMGGQASAGLVDIPEGGAAPPYRGPLVSLRLSVPLRRVARIGLTADRDVRYSAVGRLTVDPNVRNTYVLRSYGVSLAGELPADLVGQASASWEEARYLVPFLAEGGVVPRVDRMESATLSLGRAWRRSVWLGLHLEYAQRVSNVGFGDRRWRYGLGVRFPARRINRPQRILAF